MSTYVRLLICKVLTALFLFFTFPAQSEILEMMSDIDHNIYTEFAEYKPYPVEVTPEVTSYTINEDFSNVINFSQFKFTKKEMELLGNNGFVVSPSVFKEMFDVYNMAKEDGLPIFVTVDALLHSYHEIFDYCLRTLETKRFLKDLDNLTSSLLRISREQYLEATDPGIRDAALKNMAYFSVAGALLDPACRIPEEASEIASQELALIQAHAGLADSPIFGYIEDYTQYIPRGHYTLSEELERYFRAMMWYGRMTFHSEDAVFLGIGPDAVKKATRRALLITQAMDKISSGTQGALQTWESIYLPTTFFVGKAEDLGLYQYLPLAKETFKAPLSSISVDEFADEEKISLFLDKVQNLPPPEIVPEWGKGFRFMGQRFIPDSYMFTELVFPRTSRLFPKGLDVMAVLGSSRAEQILDQVYHENSDTSYTAQMTLLKTKFSQMEESVWVQNLYWNWLYCLMPLLAEKGHGFPTFMQNPAWADKELCCALGSWAELRHDTILYAKQSYTCGIANFGYRKTYVEPNPWAFARLASLVRLTLDGLENQGLLLDDFGERLQTLHSLLCSLENIAEKELTSKPLTIPEQRLIRTIGESLAWLTIFDTEHGMGDQLDDDMAVIADVHTDIMSTFKCLEEGVGRPLTLYVIVGSGEELVIALGSAFAYYEFTWPMNDRLTDEAWRKMLSAETPPELPPWMKSFIDLEGDFTVERPTNAPNHTTYAQFEMIVSLTPTTPRAGDTIEILITPDRDPGESLFLEAICGEQRVVMELKKLSEGLKSSASPMDSYVCTIDTTGWSGGKVEVSVFNPDDFMIFNSTEFILEKSPLPWGQSWSLY